MEFGEPIGAAETIYTLHSELRTFGDSFGCREASFRLSLVAGSPVERLRELTQAPEAEIRRIAAEAVPPSRKTVSVHLVEASGRRPVGPRSVPSPSRSKRWGLGGGIVSTAAPAAAAVRLLARGEIEARGALPPERCIEPGEMFSELEQRGCRFEVNDPGGGTGLKVGVPTEIKAGRVPGRADARSARASSPSTATRS